MVAAHGYRTKIEVLRDFLRAAQDPVPKTRIIGAANLNPGSFQRYLHLCTERELIAATSAGFVVTPRADPILAAIEGVISKTSELDHAVRLLERSGQNGPGQNGSNGRALRYVARHAWTELVLALPLKGRADPLPNGGVSSQRARSVSTGPPAVTGRPATGGRPSRRNGTRAGAQPRRRNGGRRPRATPRGRKRR